MIEDYLEFLRRHGRAPLTVRNYRDDIKVITRHLEKAGYSADPRDTTEETFEYLRETLPEKEETVRALLNAWDRYVGWATGRRILQGMGLLWNRRQVSRTFITPADYRRMLDAAADPFERMVLVLGGMMGCRRCEMVRLRVGDIHAESVTLHGKGHNRGLVIDQPINGTVRGEIARYMAWRAELPGIGSTDAFLVHPRTHKGGLDRETTVSDMIPRTVADIGRRVGVRASTHTLRRLFGTTIYDTTNDLVTTSRLLRHADVNVTVECYIEPSRNRERSALDLMTQALTS